jgi:ferric-dicitrate binding protein FerR (iron transport regulator)
VSASAGEPPPEEPSEREERVLRELFARESAPPPAARFQAGLRAAFAAGELGAAERSPPSRVGLDGRSASGVIEGLLLREPPPSPARDGFRDALRARFVRGELELRPEPAGDVPAPPRRLGPAGRILLGSLATAAALWLVARLVVPDRPTWRARAAGGEGPLLVDGRAVDPRDLSQLGPLLAQAATIGSQKRSLELVFDDELVLRLLPGASIETIADGTQGRELRFALHQGEVYLKSREGYAGPPVVVETPDVDMRMTGTVVGVLYEGTLSCICVARGTVEVEPRAGGAARVCVQDQRHIVLKGGEERVERFDELPDGGGAHVADLARFGASF